MNAPFRLFDEAQKVHAADVAKAHRATLRPRGAYHRGACPLCGAGRRSECFQAQAEGVLWHCHSCGEGGDAVRLEMLLGGHADRVAAARVLVGVAERVSAERPTLTARRASSGAQAAAPIDSLVVARHIWRGSVPARGTIVERWLAARGLDPHALPEALDRLRFHPACPVSAWFEGGDPSRVRTAPAMVARLERIDPTGASPAGGRIAQSCGVHVTYLAGDGAAKATLRRRDGSTMPARKMWGTAGGAGFWLSPIDGPEAAARPLVVGEGIETVWAFVQALGVPARACAVLSLRSLQGGALRDAADAVPLWNARADPAQPPMLLRDPGEVIVLVDADMKPVRMANVQRARGGRREAAMLSALDRAQLCATLARQHWRAAGARSVRTVRPPVGMDFNDMMRI